MCIPEGCYAPQIMVHLEEIPPPGTSVRVETPDTVLTQRCERNGEGWCAYSYRFRIQRVGRVSPEFVPPSTALVTITGPSGALVSQTFTLEWSTRDADNGWADACLEAEVRPRGPLPL